MSRSKPVKLFRLHHPAFSTHSARIQHLDLNLIQMIAVYALPVIFAITLHEAAHGYVARHFGDLTAYAQGRVSLIAVAALIDLPVQELIRLTNL